MSASSLQKLADDLSAKVVEECAAGRGEALLLEFNRAVGADYAATVFLKMTTALEAATDETAAEVFAWAQQFPEVAANMLADGVRRSFTDQGYALGPESERVEKAAVMAFGQRLDALFETVQPGGAA